jgi:uncharacterized surface protein with fasciclin (FAS1) repeats
VPPPPPPSTVEDDAATADPVPPPIPKPAAAEKDLITTAKAMDNLGQLLKAADQVKLLEEVGEGPYTIFAPTDAAFDKLEPALANRLKEDEAALRDVLLYHAVVGELMAEQLVEKKTVDSVAGTALQVEQRPDGVFVNGARVQEADISCSDGVLHVIDKVLVPPDLPAATETPSPDSSDN